MSGSIIPTILEKGWGFKELGHHSLFALLWLALELSWQLWVCLLANVLQWAYNEAQGLLEVESFTILDLVSSNQLCRILNGYVIL